MLIINNEHVAQVLTMPMTIDALEKAYRDLASTDSVCKPRTDIQIPTPDPKKMYQWSSVEGGSTSGYFAIRMKSDIIYEQEYNGAITQEKYCIKPGVFCGLVLLTNSHTGEPLAIMNDGLMQLMRVGADAAIGVKFMAKEDARVVGMIGSGGMARTHMEAIMAVRPSVDRLQVYSPTQKNREAFAEEMASRYKISAVACDRVEDVYRGADIVAAVTDSAVQVLDGALIEKGTHIINAGGGNGRLDAGTLKRVDAYLRFGSATKPWGHTAADGEDEYVTYAARPDLPWRFKRKTPGERGHGAMLPDRMISFADLIAGKRGRNRPNDITFSERGNLQGNQFWAVAGKVYEAAKAGGIAREVPTEWFLQDIRD
jgi:ornithine cyclodeaminase/alanine dehydrogenase-like protein (mu-crystallin family)